MRDPKRDPAGALTEVQRWANYLPFGTVGWHFTNSGNGPVIGPGATGTLTFDTVAQDLEGFRSGANTEAVIPKGLSGTYVIEACAYWAANVNTLMSIVRTTAAGVATGIANFDLTTQRGQLHAIERLAEGDRLTVLLFNNSAGNITVTAVAAGPFNVQMPYFKGYRISLL